MSHATVNADRELLIQCPYDPVHVISQMRFPYHLIKCRKNHRGAEYQQCPYDAKHVILRTRFEDHVKSCDKKSIIEPQLVMYDNRGENLQIPESNAWKIEETLSNEWDIEAPSPANLQTHRLGAAAGPNTFSSLGNKSNQSSANSFGGSHSYSTAQSTMNSETIRSPNNNNTDIGSSSGTSSSQCAGPVSYGRGRGRAKVTSSAQPVSNFEAGPSSYQFEPQYNSCPSPGPAQSFGRGRGLLKLSQEPCVRRPARSGKTTREGLEKDKGKLERKVRDALTLSEKHENGVELEQNQLVKVRNLAHFQQELGNICKQLDCL